MSYRGGGNYRGRRGSGGYGRGGTGYTQYDDSGVEYRGSGVSSSARELAERFRLMDGGNYGQLKSLTGCSFPLATAKEDGCDVSVTFQHIQSDPFAPGSQVSVHFPVLFDAAEMLSAATDEEAECRWTAAEDYILRCFAAGMERHNQSGALQVLRVSQHVVVRSAVVLDECSEMGIPTRVSIHLRVKLPGHGRRIDGRGALRIIDGELKAIVIQHVVRADAAAMLRHVNSVNDQEWLRQQLALTGLVAFVANGAVLPRAAGDSDKPLDGAVPFSSPPTLLHRFTLPCSGRVLEGMGVPRGLTIIAGGGFHGKSTLLRALELGVYNHVPDDGRTFVVTDATAVKIRAEDRRSVRGVDISPFIRNLPFQVDTVEFSTGDASGSTSQATNIMEALELGSTALLLDEDTSATNFMYRDALMEQLVPRTQEPITPFVHRVRDLTDLHGVSSIMVVGGTGQYFQYANVVLVMNAYKAEDATLRAAEIVKKMVQSIPADSAACPTTSSFSAPLRRHLRFQETFRSVHHREGRQGTKISANGLDTIRLSEDNVDVGLVEQLVEEGQLNGVAQCFALLYDSGAAAAEQVQAGNSVFAPSAATHSAFLRQPSSFCRLVHHCEAELRRARVETQSPSCYLPRGFTSLPRVFEIGAAFNRLRTLRVKRVG